ncbi:DUF58 domain-containing protein [soil metagenome]
MAGPSRIAALSFGGVRLTGRGWWFVAASAVLFAVAYGSGKQELLYVAALLGALPVIAVLVVRVRRPRLAVTRSFAPHVIPAGGTASVSLVVRNLAPARSVPAQWWDAIPWRPFETPVAELPALQSRGARFAGRGNSVALEYDLRPPRRGVFPVGPLSVQVADAFGLATSTSIAGAAQPITVTPEVIPLAESGMTVPAGDGEARLVQRRATGDEDDIMTREYRDGDAMRRVHWRATARKGELMVRQEEQRSLPEARILVDTRRTGYRDVAGAGEQDDEAESAAFEWVVRMLASVAVHLRRTGFVVTVEDTGVSQFELLSRGRRLTWGDEEFLAGLASLELTDPATSRKPATRADGPLIALVGTPEPETLDWMLAQRRPGELAVAFMVRSISAIDIIDRSFGVPAVAPQIADRLTDAGWLVVPVRADDDHAAAWEAVVMETGRSRGRA